MSWNTAIASVATALTAERPYTVNFISPIVGCMIAAATTRDQENRSTLRRHLRFSDEAAGYAEICGLRSILDGKYARPDNSGQQGETYTRITYMRDEADAHACNTLIANLFHEQLQAIDPQFVAELSTVVAELHENVVAHSNSAGFSAAQVYHRLNGRVIQFAVVDAGCGMLHNVRRVQSDITSDAVALDWCLVPGHTTRVQMRQRLPADAIANPYPAGIQTSVLDTHHKGHGLGDLLNLVSSWNGRFSVKTGIAERRYVEGVSPRTYDVLETWKGVAIEVELPVPTIGSTPLTPEDDKHLSEVGRRIRL